MHDGAGASEVGVHRLEGNSGFLGSAERRPWRGGSGQGPRRSQLSAGTWRVNRTTQPCIKIADVAGTEVQRREQTVSFLVITRVSVPVSLPHPVRPGSSESLTSLQVIPAAATRSRDAPGGAEAGGGFSPTWHLITAGSFRAWRAGLSLGTSHQRPPTDEAAGRAAPGKAAGLPSPICTALGVLGQPGLFRAGLGVLALG